MHSKTVSSIRASLNKSGVTGLTAQELEDYELKALGTNHTEMLNKEDRRTVIDYIINEKESAMIPVQDTPQLMKLSFTSEETETAIEPVVDSAVPEQESSLTVAPDDLWANSQKQESNAIVNTSDPKFQMVKATVESYGLTMEESTMVQLYSQVDASTSDMKEFMMELAQTLDSLVTGIEQQGLANVEEIGQYFEYRLAEADEKVKKAADKMLQKVASNLAASNGLSKKKNQTFFTKTKELQNKQEQNNNTKLLELRASLRKD